MGPGVNECLSAPGDESVPAPARSCGRDFLSTAPDAKLLIHSVDAAVIFNSASTARHAAGIDIEHTARQLVGLPPGAYIVHAERLAYSSLLEMTAMADVLLHPSRTEGFGMHILEAQLLGVPAITTRFGAMADYTKYGEAVPPEGPYSFPMGIAAEPSRSGIARALVDVYRGAPGGDRADAMAFVRERMSSDAVVREFESLLAAPPPPPRAYRRLTYDAVLGVRGQGGGSGGAASFRLDSVRHEWVLLTAEGATQTVDEDAVAMCIADAARMGATTTEGAAVSPSGGTARLDGTEGARAFTAARDFTVLLIYHVDGSVLPPSRRPPLLARTARLREVHDDALAAGLSPAAALDAFFDALLTKVLPREPHGPSGADEGSPRLVVGAVSKPERGC